MAALATTLIFALASLISSAADTRLSAPAKTAWRPAARTAHQTQWQSATLRTNTATGKIHSYTNAFIELGGGLNITNSSGQFVPANPSFVLTNGGAEANHTGHRLAVPGDLWLGDGIKVTKPDGAQVVFQPLGIDYYDPTDGRSVLLDAVTNAVGWLTASNEIVFSNCLTRIKASIRIRNMSWGLESDLILHEAPPDPISVGLTSAARLEMLTEQFNGSSPVERYKFIHREHNPVKIAQMVEPHFIDAELSFGSMKMVQGKAFGIGKRTNGLAHLPSPVGKSFLNIQQRRVLVEAVEHQRVLPLLNQLPPAGTSSGITNAALNKFSTNEMLVTKTRRLPALVNVSSEQSRAGRRASIRAVSPDPLTANGPLVANTKKTEPAGLILDYQLVTVTDETDFTFRGGTNYLVSTTIQMAGITTIEGGAIIKMNDGTGLYIAEGGTLICDTTNWLPAIFCSIDDNTVGEVMPGSTGDPWQLGSAALNFYGGSYELRNLRFRHIGNPIQCDNGTSITARNMQFVNAYACFWSYGGTFSLNVFNALAKDCDYFYAGDVTLFRGEHLTTHNDLNTHNAMVVLGYAYTPESSTAVVRNSLLVAADYPPNYAGYPPTLEQVEQPASDTGVFETIEGGAHYLPTTTSHRGIGVTNIDAALKRELAEMTTYKPNLLTGTLTTDQTLAPVIARDVATLGYHYPAVDYVAKNLTLQNSTLTLQGGVVLAGTHTTGNPSTSIHLNPGRLLSTGTPTRMNRILRLNQIQENVTARGSALIGDGYHDGEFYPELRLRFTEMSSLAGEPYLAYVWNDLRKLEACHSSFYNGSFFTSLYGGVYQTVGLTNNLFRYVGVVLQASSPAYLFAYNNTFKDGTITSTGGNEDWRLEYNIFDRPTIYTDGSYAGEHNGYVGLTQSFQEDSFAVVPTPTLAYANGPLGRFYLGDDFLRNRGIVTANLRSLYHFTTRADQAKEGNSVLDYGFHYVAVSSGESSVAAADFDGDGLADYFEDTTGNGLFASGDLSNFQNSDSDGDGLEDGYEYLSTLTDPTVAVTGGTGGSDAYKDSDNDDLFNQEELQSGKNPRVPDVATPRFSPLGGTYASAQNVAITCPTTGAAIYYTIDGSEPTTSSTPYSAPFSLAINKTLKAKAFKTGWTPSDTETEGYHAAANTVPTVSVLPGTGLTFGASDSIEFLVQASDPNTGGSVTNIQLYRGDLKVAEATPGPLRFTLRNVPSGSYAFTARAIDNKGAVGVSSSVSVTISAGGPSLSLVGAQPFFTSSPGALLATITGVNPGTLTSLTLNGNAVPKTAGSFMLFPALTEGENTFTLLANGTVSATTKVYLDTAVPSIAITAPANNSTFGTDRINVIGTFSESSLKRITVNGVLAFITGPGNFEARNVFLPQGANTITALAEDISGNTNAYTISVTGSATPVDPVQLTVTPVAGFKPLSTTFSVTVSGSLPGTLENVYYDFEGDGITDQTETTTASINHTYNDAGQYFPVVTVKTTAGRFSSVGGWNVGGLRINVQESPEQVGGDISIADPVDLKIGPAGHLFILSRSGEVVKEYDSTPTYVRSITLPSGSVPTGLDVDSAGNVYVALSGHHQVAKCKLTSGTFGLDTAFHTTGLIGKANQTSGTGNGEFNTPYDVAVTPDGAQISVSDSANHRIQQFKTSNGDFVGLFGASGTGNGQFNTPKGLTYDGAGYLYVVDSGNNRVAVWLSSSAIGTSGSSGTALGYFQGAVNLCVGPRGIYVGDAGNDRFQIFEPLRSGHGAEPTPFDFRLALSTQFGGLDQPNAIAPIADFLAEKIYIADTGKDRVIKATLPEATTPDAIWNQMKTSLLAGNIAQALGHYSIDSVEGYRRSFTSAGATVLSSIMDKTLTAVAIDGATAQYYFEDVIEGTTFTFPVEFVKENGVWKILEF